METNNVEFIEFWKETSQTGGSRIEIINSKLIKFLESNGYRKLVKGNNFQLVQVVRGCVVRPVEVFQIRDFVTGFILELERNDVWEEFLKVDFLSRRVTESLKSISIDFNQGNKNTAIFFYKNGVLKVTATEMEIISYEDYEGYVWEDQILDREFNKEDSENAEFRTFCKDLSKNDSTRLLSLQSIKGYLLHGYKDRANTKAIILMDEIVNLEEDISEGGTGKTVLADGIGMIVPYLRKDGKNLKTDSRFFFSDVEEYHKVIVFDDVKSDFDFESLYSVITGDMPIERKYKNPEIMTFQDAPKVLITSNFMVRGTGGNSEFRRKTEFEVSAYYRTELTILEKFGHRFFDEWSQQEWSLFDNYMMECTQIFLNNGIVEAAPINIASNRLALETDPKFVSFLNEALENPASFAGLEEGDFIRFNKANLFRKYTRTFPEANPISAIRFKKWIDKYCQFKNKEVNHSESNGQQIVKIKK